MFTLSSPVSSPCWEGEAEGVARGRRSSRGCRADASARSQAALAVHRGGESPLPAIGHVMQITWRDVAPAASFASAVLKQALEAAVALAVHAILAAPSAVADRMRSCPRSGALRRNPFHVPHRWTHYQADKSDRPHSHSIACTLGRLSACPQVHKYTRGCSDMATSHKSHTQITPHSH